jgi:cysteinyl-tRNA synthetase
MPHPFRLYNTLTRDVSDFVPMVPGRVGLYVCGMTVYDDAHVGHARAMVVFDSFVRYLRHRGWGVTFVRNFTDVDDKIIRRANELGESPAALAQRYIDAFHADVHALGLATPDFEPRVTTSMDDIIAMIDELITKGHAYANDGNVWFAVSTDDKYGKLSGQRVEELQNPDEGSGKRSGNDFALWKAAKAGEPAWESPWGPGRPGWHIECSAMSRRTLGETFDIHGGGLDLVFPHHENEVAQSECANHAPYANYWMHNGLLTMASGQKMGKSLGNVISVRTALEGFPAEALRLYYLQNHYRSPLPWSGEALPEALAMLARLYEAREKAEAMVGDGSAAAVALELGPDALAIIDLTADFAARFYGALDTDFNTAKALGYALQLARAMNRFAGHKKAAKRGAPVVRPALAALREIQAALGLLTMETAAFHDEVKIKRLGALGLDRSKVEALLAERVQARATKDWARADAIRGELDQLGIVVMDTDGAVQWRVRLAAAEG